MVPVRRRETPTGEVSLIVSFGPRIRVLDPGEPETVVDNPTSFVAPIGTTWALTEYTGEQYGLELKMTPLGAGMLLGAPMCEFTGRAVELSDVWGDFAARLRAQLAELPSWAARFAALDTVLTDRLRDAREPPEVAAMVWDRLTRADGRSSIADLVAESGRSHRHVATHVREHLGLGPKELACVAGPASRPAARRGVSAGFRGRRWRFQRPGASWS